jgi:hypothetical protein
VLVVTVQAHVAARADTVVQEQDNTLKKLLALIQQQVTLSFAQLAQAAVLNHVVEHVDSQVLFYAAKVQL